MKMCGVPVRSDYNHTAYRQTGRKKSSHLCVISFAPILAVLNLPCLDQPWERPWRYHQRVGSQFQMILQDAILDLGAP